MTPEEWHKVKEVLQGALDLDPEGRADYLDSACPKGGSTRVEVESLLRSHDEHSTYLEQAVGIGQSDIPTCITAESWIEKRLGSYLVLEEIGKGGMGEVFRACRADDQFQKQVAIKLLRAGEASPFVVGRFRNERQILASLDHPNIARLIDGGTTEEGIPYLTMELVEGLPIDDYCDAHKLSITHRLKLFLDVCSAVQYAHQRLIVHRDLKPNNILVTTEGVPKLLDFGIAKILDPGALAGGFENTLTLFRILTPGYASPEQVRGEPITTSSDVYSLGVILYELLTGRSPYGNRKRTPEEISNAVCELDPEKPSSVVTHAMPGNGAQNLEEIAALREGSAKKLRKRLCGDLDNIALMALRKEPQRRYLSVEQFAADVQRHLDNLPVLARRDTALYRASKFIVRHKVGLAATGVLILMLLTALAITLQEARIAQRRFNDVRALANSLIFDVHDSIRDLPGSTPARKIIVDLALQYLNSLARESGGDLALQRELATAYERVGLVQGHYLQNNLGDTNGSLNSYLQALAIRKQVVSRSRDRNDRLALAQTYRSVADLQWATGNRKESRDSIDQALAISEGLNQVHPGDSHILFEVGHDHRLSGWIGYVNDPDALAKSNEDNRKALAADEAAAKINPGDVPTLEAYAMDLGVVGSSIEETNPQAALSYYQKQLEVAHQLSQRSHATRYARQVALAYRNIGNVYYDLRDYPHTHENYVQYLSILQEANRADPKSAILEEALGLAYANIALADAKLGKTDSAFESWGRGHDILQKLVSSTPEHIAQRHSLAIIAALGGTIFMTAHRPQLAFRQFEESRTFYQSLGSSFEESDLVMPGACSEKMGEAAALSGEADVAANDFHQALGAAEPMISAKLPELNALYVAADAYSGLGDLSFKRAQHLSQTAAGRKANLTEARSWYAKSLDTWRRIDHPIHLMPGSSLEVGDPIVVAKKLQQCEAMIAGMHSTLTPNDVKS
jgi:serine/threonine protein kinase